MHKAPTVFSKPLEAHETYSHFYELGLLFAGVLVRRALLFGVYVRALVENNSNEAKIAVMAWVWDRALFVTVIIPYIYIYIYATPPLRSMDFRLLGRGRLKGFSNSLISNAVSMKIHCTGC